MRHAHPVPGFPGPPGPMKETVYIYPNSMVRLHAPRHIPLSLTMSACVQIYFKGEHIRVANIVSYNEAGELLLTYSFSNGIPGPFPREGTLEGETLQGAIVASAGGVDGTLKQIRKLLKADC